MLCAILTYMNPYKMKKKQIKLYLIIQQYDKYINKYMKFAGLYNKQIKKSGLQDISSDQDEMVELSQKSIKIKKQKCNKKHGTTFKPKKLLLKQKQQVFQIIQIIDDEKFKYQSQVVEILDLQSQIKRNYFFNKQALKKVKIIQQQIIQNQICSICLCQLAQKKGKLLCNHIFCLQCIQNSTKFSTNCPYCRKKFDYILFQNQKIQVNQKKFVQQQGFQQQPCYICGRNDNQNQLLVCDRCNFSCCHLYCDIRLNNIFPRGNWYCLDCQNAQDQNDESEPQQVESMRNLLRIYRLNSNLRH